LLSYNSPVRGTATVPAFFTIKRVSARTA